MSAENFEFLLKALLKLNIDINIFGDLELMLMFHMKEIVILEGRTLKTFSKDSLIDN